jgi:virulence factor Mce-like protein
VITGATKLKLLAFAALSVLGMSYLGFTYVGLDRALLGNGYDIAADFRDSGGIFVNAEVTYRGVAVGRVTDMDLVEDGVRVTLTIDPEVPPIPADAEAVVANRSSVGEQYVDLRPGEEERPYLEEGSVIPIERTSIPIPVEQLLLNMDELFTSLDRDNLRIVVEEFGKAFAGGGEHLARLIDNGDLLLARAEESLPETLRLITDGVTVLETQAASRSAIEQWAADLRLFTDTLVEMDPDVRRLLATSPDAGVALQQLVENAGPGLGSLIRNLDIMNKVQIPRLDGIRQILITYPDVVSGGYTVVRNDDGVIRPHFGIALNNKSHPCLTGYVSTGQTRSPGAVANVDETKVSCRVINGVDPRPEDGYDENGSSIRGEQNIGRSGGVGATEPKDEIAHEASVLRSLVGEMLRATELSRTVG